MSREIKLLVDHREELVNTRTRVQNRLRWHLHELDPELDPPARGLDRIGVLDRLAAWLAARADGVHADGGSGEAVVVRIGRRAGRRHHRVDPADQRAGAGARPPGPARHAAAAGPARLWPVDRREDYRDTATVTRFRSEACYAMHAGVAPIPASSGKTNRHRLARGGNRQLNAALHRSAFTQIRFEGFGRAYYQRRRGTGDTMMQALRAVKRRLARIVFNLLQHQQPALPTLRPAAA